MPDFHEEATHLCRLADRLERVYQDIGRTSPEKGRLAHQYAVKAGRVLVRAHDRGAFPDAAELIERERQAYSHDEVHGAERLHSWLFLWLYQKWLPARGVKPDNDDFAPYIFSDAMRALAAALPTDTASQPSAPTVVKDQIGHSDDYTWVQWGDQRFTFKLGMQAAVVRELLNAKRPLHKKEITRKIDSQDTDWRPRKALGKHPALGTMIIKGESKGTYQIANPPCGMSEE